MNWCNTLAGQEVRLSNRARARFGMAPASLEDTGVVENAQAVGELLGYGLALGEIDALQVDDFTEIEHGTARQVEGACKLACATMVGIKGKVDKIVADTLRGLPHGDDKELGKLLEWAGGQWELTATFGNGEGLGAWLRLNNPGGLAVFICPVFAVPEDRGDTLCALLDVLCREAMKSTATETVSYWYERLGFQMPVVDATTRARILAMSPKEAHEWLNQNDPSGLEEALFLMGGEEIDEGFAHEMCKTICLISGLGDRIERVIGRGASLAVALGRIEESATQWPEDDIKAFVEGCCEILREGLPTLELLPRVLPCAGFEIMPGQWEIVDFGMNLPLEQPIYEEMNDAVWNEGEIASLPLRMDADDMVALLARVTVAERLIIRLASILE